MSANPYTLRRWRPEREPTPFACLLLASRNSGKSHLIRTLWEKTWKTRFKFVVTFCGSDHDESYPDFLPGKLFFKTFRPEVVGKFKAINEQRTRDGLSQIPVLFILDDCSETRERYDEELRSLYTRGRHWGFSVIFATQGIQLSDTVARNNSDFVLLGRQRGAAGRELAVDNFLKGLPEVGDLPVLGGPSSTGRRQTEKAFLNTLYKRNTVGFQFIVVTTSNPYATEFKDLVQVYKSPIEAFKRG